MAKALSLRGKEANALMKECHMEVQYEPVVENFVNECNIIDHRDRKKYLGVEIQWKVYPRGK